MAKPVTMIKIDYRRKLPFHVYCVTCDWQQDIKDMVEAHQASESHKHDEPKQDD